MVPKADLPTVQVRISEKAHQRLSVYVAHQPKKGGRKVLLQDVATVAVNEYLKKRGA